MKLAKIYQDYYIPKSLQLHMLKVATVGKYVIDNWEDTKINKPIIVAALLIHDLGNLVKFDLSEDALVIDPTLLTDEWRQRQTEMRSKYGNHSHQATQQMLKELHIPEKIIALTDNMDASDVCKIARSSFEQQICQYADMRVTPNGITSLSERLEDLRARYKNRYPKWGEKQSFAKNSVCAQQIEDTLQQHTAADITNIPAETISSYLVELAQFEIPTE